MRLILSICLCAISSLSAETAPRFRTDADGPVDPKKDKAGRDNKDKNADDTPQWYEPVEGKFPPAGSAHAISGELTMVDHLERRFYLRVDRNDSQERGVWDLPVDGLMLPYGSIWYHGEPAALQDIPLGTHLHGLFYLKASDDTSPPPPGPHNRVTPEIGFKRCLQLEDDFTFHRRQKQLWNIESVDLELNKLSATLQENGKATGEPKQFDLLSSTRVYQSNGFVDLTALEKGQSVLFNLTWATLYGPGRITDLWIDTPSRQQASVRQLERHRNHLRERGLAGWIDAVDDESQIVTITFFGGVDPKLFDELTAINTEPMGWPLSKPEDNPGAPKGTIAVARESLMTYDPVNDRKGGNILDIKKIPVEPGSSGVQIKVKCDMLLEGFRPRRIVRFYPATWKVIALPREEQYEGRE